MSCKVPSRPAGVREWLLAAAVETDLSGDSNISILNHVETLSGHFFDDEIDDAGSEGLDGMEADHIELSSRFLDDKNDTCFVLVELDDCNCMLGWSTVFRWQRADKTSDYGRCRDTSGVSPASLISHVWQWASRSGF